MDTELDMCEAMKPTGILQKGSFLKLSGEMSGKKKTTKPGTVVFMLLFLATNNYEPQKKSFLESMALFLAPKCW